MRPIKAKDLIASTAEELDIDYSIVKDVVGLYWKDVRTSLSELKAPIVTVTSFGNFKIKHWKLEEEKVHLNNIINKARNRNTERSGIILSETNEKLKLVSNLEEMICSEKQRKEFIKTHRKRNAKGDI